MKKILKELIVPLLVLTLMIFSVWGIYLKQNTQPLPVLMYHHFADTAEIDTVVTPARFREQMTALKEAGFTAVTQEQMLDYVDRGTPLPEKPVLITMDDGYTSNLTVAAPILEELGMCATVFVIGVNEGEETYIHSGAPLSPARFSYEEAAQWVEKGVLDLQSHTFDMHQLADYGFSARDGMLPLAEEETDAYAASLCADLDAFLRRREGWVGTPLQALAYPFGYYTAETDALLQEAGILFTFTVEEHCSRLVEGDRDSLRCMGRINVTDRMTGEQLVQRLLRVAH